MGRYLLLQYLFVPIGVATEQAESQKKSVWGFFCFASLGFEGLGEALFALHPCTQKVIPGAHIGPKSVFAPALDEGVG